VKTTLIAAALIFTGMLSLPENLSAAITIDTVPVGDIRNRPDPNGGRGEVWHAYAIGTYEVTLSQYTAFLNSVGGSDPYQLYDPNMATDIRIAGISRSGSPGSYRYSVIGDGNRPVTYVSWFDAARFVNWMQNGQPTGNEVANTTETGVYPLNGATSGEIFRNTASQFWIPTPDEWYKAAHYDPSPNAPASHYWTYPTQSQTPPATIGPNSTNPNSANYGHYGSTGNVLTPVGSYALASSHYGTFDQGGNVWEWTDGTTSTIPVYGLVLGGGWDSSTLDLAGAGGIPVRSDESVEIGFRIAMMIPEPNCLGLFTLGLVLLPNLRKVNIRRRR
jgi:hypothetical protein